MGLLREFIRSALLQCGPPVDGAGIVLIRDFEDGFPRILILTTDDGEYDLPKGHLEPGENTLCAARRETYEEAGVAKVEFLWGTEGHLCGTCMFFMGYTEDEPSIVMNKETCEFEHRSAVWLPPEDVLKGIDCWMKPAIEWALTRVMCDGGQDEHLRSEPIQGDGGQMAGRRHGPPPLRSGPGYTS